MDDTRIMIVAGGKTLCGEDWARQPTELPVVHKLYFPIRGTATLRVDESATRLRAASATATLPARSWADRAAAG